jgi:hypothetical protein
MVRSVSYCVFVKAVVQFVGAVVRSVVVVPPLQPSSSFMADQAFQVPLFSFP